jgi:hypothetical protein
MRYCILPFQRSGEAKHDLFPSIFELVSSFVIRQSSFRFDDVALGSDVVQETGVSPERSR